MMGLGNSPTTKGIGRNIFGQSDDKVIVWSQKHLANDPNKEKVDRQLDLLRREFNIDDMTFRIEEN